MIGLYQPVESLFEGAQPFDTTGEEIHLLRTPSQLEHGTTLKKWQKILVPQ